MRTHITANPVNRILYQQPYLIIFPCIQINHILQIQRHTNRICRRIHLRVSLCYHLIRIIHQQPAIDQILRFIVFHLKSFNTHSLSPIPISYPKKRLIHSHRVNFKFHDTLKIVIVIPFIVHTTPDAGCQQTETSDNIS